jgi:TolB protein
VGPSQAAFTGRNGLISYFDQGSGREGIWTVDPATDRRHRLTTEFSDQNPDFSPDGTWIVFGHGGALALMRPDGSHEHVIARPKGGGGSPAWAPDGERIVYTSGNGSSSSPTSLRVMNKDGTHDHSLNVDAGCAAWSPDGKWLTATITRHYVSHIIRLHPDGTHVQRMTSYRGATVASDGLGEWCADWSPDGRHLVYSRAWSGSAMVEHFAVYVMRPDGSHDHAIVRSWTTQSFGFTAAYSPDGNRVVYNRGDHLFTIDANGGNRAQLTSGPEISSDANWQPL